MARTINTKRSIILIAHNIRSTHNVGSLFRTAEGLGVNELILSGYTPYPKTSNESRLPHLADKLDKQISKTALGAQNSLKWQRIEDLAQVVEELKYKDYTIVGLEQDKKSIDILEYSAPNKIALIIGNEVTGLQASELKLCDDIIEITMRGKKESFNVVQASAMAMFQMANYSTQTKTSHQEDRLHHPQD
ncbi:MAG: TrmH family RNA methyltransferase [Candidatus Saccharibacteria bacterium]